MQFLRSYYMLKDGYMMQTGYVKDRRLKCVELCYSFYIRNMK